VFLLNNRYAAVLSVILLTAFSLGLQSNSSAETTANSSVDQESAKAIKQRIGPGDPALGRTKSEICQGCHGELGDSPDPMVPSLAGQYGIYISKQLRDFQAGLRTHQIMSAMAATISDKDLADISAYFSSRPKMKGNGLGGNPLGEKLFHFGDMSRMMVGCVNCHGIRGKGKSPINYVFPVIGGQRKNYLIVQLVNFREGNRANSPGGVMNIVTQHMTDEEIEALADYISTL